MQKWLYSKKSGCIRAKSLCSCKSGFNREKVVVLGQKLLYLGKNCCNWGKVVVFGQSGCIRSKVVVFGQTVCFWEKLVVIGQK